MDVRRRSTLRFALKRSPIKAGRIFHGAVDVELPLVERDVRLLPEIENRPIADEMLARRKAIRIGPRRSSGQETPFPCPPLFGPRELARLRKVVAVVCAQGSRLRTELALGGGFVRFRDDLE